MLTLTASQSDNVSTHIGARVVFAILLIVPTVIGFAPLGLFLERPLLIAIVAAIISAQAIYYAYRLRTEDARPVTFLEAVCVSLAGLFFSSTMGLSLMWWYWIVSDVVIPLLSFVGLNWDPETWGRYAVIVYGAIFVPATANVVADHLRDNLFPRTGIGNAPLFPGLTWWRFLRIAIPALIPAVAIGAAWIAGWLTLTWFCVLSLFYFLIVSSPFSPKKRAEAAPAVRAVTRLLRASGYTIPERLQTHDAELDRLLATFDIVAYSSANALAFQFKIGGEDSPAVTWTEATSLRAAIWAAYKAAAQSGVTVHNVRPVMVLAGRKADDSLKAFAEKEAIHIVELQDMSVIKDIVADKFSDEQLRDLARSLIRVRIPVRSPASSEPVQEARP